VGAEIVVIDTLEAVHADDPSNPSAIKGVLNFLRDLRRPNRGIVVVDHLNKPTMANRGAPAITRILGATGKGAWVEELLSVALNKSRTLQTVASFSKYHAEPQSFGIELSRVDGLKLTFAPICKEDRSGETLQRIADALCEPMTVNELEEVSGVSRKTIDRHREQLGREFRVKRRRRVSKGQPWEYYVDEQSQLLTVGQ